MKTISTTTIQPIKRVIPKKPKGWDDKTAKERVANNYLIQSDNAARAGLILGEGIRGAIIDELT